MGSYETPDYKVLEKEDAFELRKYPAFSVVKYVAANDPYADAAFQTLFSYIQGNPSKKS